MNTSRTTGLLLLILVFVGLGCRDQIQTIPEADNAGYLPLPSVNRLEKRIYKTVILEGPVVEPEIVDVGVEKQLL
ncbi:hypothetical protein [Fibrella forsythiae]|uniref:Uncharacterized protein n=1 Tax=Fibrella forsythiae TaxID=2817061 RepID=A0ABS3JC89_9BACT|nr:hypothetical protein [Fibrella forsythiae]MBO0947620.1 hypothetical protein [Fibrella forsythiae]